MNAPGEALYQFMLIPHTSKPGPNYQLSNKTVYKSKCSLGQVHEKIYIYILHICINMNVNIIYPYSCLHAQSHPTLCDLIDDSPPGSSVHGIFQAIILEWVAISFSNIYLYTHTIFLNLCYNSQYVIEYMFHRDNFSAVI